MRKRIKILFLDHASIAGGAQICLANHVKALDRRIFQPLLAIDRTGDGNNIFNGLDIPIYKISFAHLKRKNPVSLINLLRSCWEFNRLVGSLKPEIVVANTTRTLIIAALAKGDYKLISYLRDYDYPLWLMKLLSPKVDKFLAVSRSVNAYYGGKEPKYEVVYIGSNMEEKIKSLSTRKIREWKQRLGIKDKELVIGFAGRLVEWKGAQVLVDAFSQIKNSKVKLLIFGTGQRQEGNIEKMLQDRIAKLKLFSRIKMMGFFPDQALMYKLMDIFVLPSQKEEPFATSVIEAAISKRAIVATKTGGTIEFIKDGFNGLLVEACTSDGLARALVKLINNRRLAQKLAFQARSCAKGFTEEKLAGKLGKIYQDII